MSYRDHDTRKAWIGQPWPIDLSALPIKSKKLPLQYQSLSERRSAKSNHLTHTSTELGYSSETPKPSPDERRKMGAKLEEALKGEKDAAQAPVVEFSND